MTPSSGDEQPDTVMGNSDQSGEPTASDGPHPIPEITTVSEGQSASLIFKPTSPRPRSLSLDDAKHPRSLAGHLSTDKPRAASAPIIAPTCSAPNLSAVENSEVKGIASPENGSVASQEQASITPELELPPTTPLIKEESESELKDDSMKTCLPHSPLTSERMVHHEKDTVSQDMGRSSTLLKGPPSKNKEEASTATETATKKRKAAARTFAEYWGPVWRRILDQDDEVSSPKKGNKILDYAAKRSDIMTEGPAGISLRAELGDDVEIMDDIEARTKDEQMSLIKQSIDMSDPTVAAEFYLLKEASFSFGHSKCSPEDGKWRLKTLKKNKIDFATPLFHHQMIGVSWMLAREMSPKTIRGGILADEMGLGKTLEMLACASQNLPNAAARMKGRIGTLIVCPKGLINQWTREIRRHHDKTGRPRVVKYIAGNRLEKEDWDDHDFVITNYHQIILAFPPDNIMDRVERLRRNNDDEWRTLFNEHAEDLIKHKWWRVVLDEGHSIKNRDSRISRACSYIAGTHRWLLTGTPVQNSTDELFPILRFLITKREEFMKFNEFRDTLGVSRDTSKHDENMTRLRTLSREITLSRKGTDTLMGKAILEVPAPYPTELELVELQPYERKVWDALIDYHKRQPKKSPFELSTQLRNATSHFAMVEPNLPPSDGPEEPQCFPGDSIERFCRKCCRVLLCPTTATCGHAFCRECAYNAKRSSNKRLKTDNPSGKNAEQTGFECPSCRVWTTGVQQCRDASKCYLGGEKPRVLEKRKGRAKSRASRTPKKRKRNNRKKREPDISRHRLLKVSTKKHRVPGDDENWFQPPINAADGKALEFFNEHDNSPWNPVPQSAKTKRTMEKILEWQHEAPEEKIIVFSRWLFPMVILGQTLFQHGIKFLYYWGGLKHEERQMQTDSFEHRKDVKVMLISIHCGAEGLNLPFASRAILLDLSWHTCEEQQAFGRIHRIKQTKRVRTVRIVARDTLDEHILELQKKKEGNISEMREGKSSKRPTRKELIELLQQSGVSDQIKFSPGSEDEQDDDGLDMDELLEEDEDEESETEGSEYMEDSDVSSGTID